MVMGNVSGERSCRCIFRNHRTFFMSIVLLIYTFLFFPSGRGMPTAAAQEGPGPQRDAVRVFLDIDDYQEYIKLEVPFVDYVRDRNEAQVHILMTRQETGSGGREYTLTFIGQQNFAGRDDTLKCVSRQLDPEEVIRRNIVRTMKMGLVRYVSKTPLAADISIDYRQKRDPAAVVDKWDYWVFNIESEGQLSGEESSREFQIDGSISADRVTPFWKMSFGFDSEYNREEYDTDTRTISSLTRSQEFEGLVVKSLGEHWSAGCYGSALASIYTNTKFSWDIAPALEYNVFPYSESTRREFRFLYRIDYTNIEYDEETIFGETPRESLRREPLRNVRAQGTLGLRQRHAGRLPLFPRFQQKPPAFPHQCQPSALRGFFH